MTASAAPGTGGVFGSRWTVATIRGVPLFVGPSLLLLIGLFTYWLARAYLVHPAFAAATVGAWIAAAVTTVVFIACIFAHEVGHAVTSLDRGVTVRGITLFLLGGVTESIGEPRRAADEVVIVGIGPLISLLIAATFGLAVRVLPDFTVFELVAGYLAWLNAAMAIFNLVPGYPLDGGRLLRALLWMITGSRHRATRLAARVGQVFAATLLLGAVLSFTGVPVFEPRAVWIAVRILASMGLWGGLIGIFLLRSSSDAYQSARRREQLGRRRVRDLMGTVPPTVPADVQLSDLAVRLQRRPSVLWPVGRPLVGGITLDDLDGVPRDQWSVTTARAVAEPDVFVADDTPMDEAVDLLVRTRDRMLIAVRDGEPVGLLTPSLVADVST